MAYEVLRNSHSSNDKPQRWQRRHTPKVCSRDRIGLFVVLTASLVFFAHANGRLQGTHGRERALDLVNALSDPPLIADNVTLESISNSCYSDWNTLVDDVEADTTGGNSYFLCRDSVFDLSINSTSPLVVSTSDTLIQCGDDGSRNNQCLIFGGLEQIVLSGSPENLVFSGLTLIGSSEAAISASGSATAKATFSDCEFSGHTGKAAVFIYDNSVVQLPDIPEDGSMTLELESCIFSDNDISFGAIANLAGSAMVSDSVFAGNIAQNGAIAVWFGGDLSLYSSCFVGNTANTSQGAIYFQPATVLTENKENYGQGNTAAAGNCTDIFQDYPSNSTCELFTSDLCISNLIPTTPPSAAPTFSFDCFDEWEELLLAVNMSATLDLAATFIICPGSIFNITAYEEQNLAPLVIESSNITLQCGKDGSRANTCVFQGGKVQIILLDSVINVLIQGIIMKEATEVSVRASLVAPFSVEFNSCLWEVNSGTSTVLVESTDGSPPSPLTGNMPSSSPIPTATPPPTDSDDDLIGPIAGLDDDSNQTGTSEESEEKFTFAKCSFRANSVTDAVVMNLGASVEVESCDFTANRAEGGSLILTEHGSSAVTTSCFQGNQQSSTQGIIFGDSDSFLDFEDNFGVNNSFGLLPVTENTCEGIFAQRTGVCSGFDSDVCELLVLSNCLSNWVDLYKAIDEAKIRGVGGLFTLCEDTVYDLDGLETFAPIEIMMENTVIQCAHAGARSSNCTITGGSTQFEIAGAPTGVEFRGLTMSGSSVAAIRASGSRNAIATFTDCEFADHYGLAAILNYKGTTSPERRLSLSALRGDRRNLQSNLPPPVDRSMTVKIEYCHFNNNDVAYAPVTNLGGNVELSDTRFLNNTSDSGGLGVWFNGGASIESTCFIGNVGIRSGSAFFAINTTLAPLVEDRDNFMNGNTALNDDKCTGFFQAGGCQAEGVCQGFCIQLGTPNCTAADAPTSSPTSSPTSPPSLNLPDCYSDWTGLSTAIQSGFESVITICQDSFLNVGDALPIVIGVAEILIRCGESGVKENNCTISGGASHFRIIDPLGSVNFEGIVMTGSSLASILASGTSSSGEVNFLRCEWKQNSGETTILIYNEAEGQLFQEGQDIGLITSDDSISLNFEFCIFRDNDVSFAVIANVGGDVEFSQSIFQNNINTKAGVISATSGAKVEFTSSCFVENTSDLAGTIFSDFSSTVVFTEGYFVANNSGSCNGIFKEAGNICLISAVCEGVCDTSGGGSCVVDGFDYGPSEAPTASPIINISAIFDMIDDKDLREESFTSTSVFIIIMFVVICVVVGGIGAFFVCKRKDGSQGKEAEDGEDEDDEYEAPPESIGLIRNFLARRTRTAPPSAINDDEFEVPPESTGLIKNFLARRTRTAPLSAINDDEFEVPPESTGLIKNFLARRTRTAPLSAINEDDDDFNDEDTDEDGDEDRDEDRDEDSESDEDSDFQSIT